MAEPKRLTTKRVMAVAGVVCFLVLALGLVIEMRSPPPPVSQPAPLASTGPVSAEASLGKGQPSAEFNVAYAERLRLEQQRQFEQMKAEVARRLDEIAREQAQRDDELRRRVDEASRSGVAAPAPPVPIEPIKIEGIRTGPDLLPVPGSITIGGGATGTVTPPAAREPGRAGPDITATSAPAQPAAQTKLPIVPPNGFIRGRLLSGVVATVGQPPTNALIRLEGRYRSANGFAMDLDGCMLIVEARAELAAGRIDGKPARLVCNFEDGRSQTWDVSGWLVDADGIRGIRGVIVSNEEKKIALRGFAGTLEAAGRALQAQQFTSTVGTGGATTSFTGDVGRAIAGGAVAGAGNAFGEEVLNYYRLFAPSVQVGAQTALSVVLANMIEVPPEGAYVTPTYTPGVRR
jgi:hypothetical protein